MLLAKHEPCGREGMTNGMITERLVASFLVLALTLASTGSAAADETGIASRYTHGGKTASGRTASPKDLFAAHRTLPFGTRVKVENLSNGKSVVVTIIDRGPFIKSRIIDISSAAAELLGFSGLQRVRISVVN